MQQEARGDTFVYAFFHYLAPSAVVQSAGQRAQTTLLYVPKSYDPTRPTPLVISIHRAALWPAHQMNTSRRNRLADEHAFIVVYPLAAASTQQVRCGLFFVSIGFRRSSKAAGLSSAPEAARIDGLKRVCLTPSYRGQSGIRV